MKAIQSYWLNQKKELVDYKAGWVSARFNLFSWALSSLKLSHFFPQTELFTDTIGADLSYKLQLPYDKVNIDLDIVKKNSTFWVENKIFTYSIQQQPFVHVDTDAYVFQPINKQLLGSQIFAQNIEFDQAVYMSAYEDLMKNSLFFPSILKKDLDGRLTAINAGIIGGNNIKIFKDFAKFTKVFLEKNHSYLVKNNSFDFNPFIEQFLFKKFVESHNVSINYFSQVERGPKSDYQLADFIKLPNDNSYIHLMNYKKNLTVCEQLAQRLWLESPELYERVLIVCKELEFTHHYFSQPAIDNYENTPFYRTANIIRSFYASVLPDYSAETLALYIETLPDKDEQKKRVITDVFQFEILRKAFIEKLPNLEFLSHYWKSYSKQVNYFLSISVEEYCQKEIRHSPYCQRIESEWNWAETNEFALQTNDRDFANNLQQDPSYYEVILYIYLHQGIVREQLLDPLNILILDFSKESITITNLIKTIIKHIVKNQPKVEQQRFVEIIMSRIRHFLYQGILEFAVVE